MDSEKHEATARELTDAFNPLAHQLPFEILRHRDAIAAALGKAVEDERAACAQLLKNYLDAFEEAALLLPLIAEKRSVIETHYKAILARGCK